MIARRFNPALKSPRERGYVLITLIFFVAVLAISLAAILPDIKQQMIRDEEEEMVHRGAQYTRAIRLYYKKNGRYPAKVEDLENTNNIRYLRKRYKDPTTRGEDGGAADFKILHFGDPNVKLQQGLNAAAQAAAAAGAAQGLSGGALDRAVRRGEVAAAAAAVIAQQQQQNGDPSQNPGASGDGSSGGSGDGSNPAGTPAGAAPSADTANSDQSSDQSSDQPGGSKPSGGAAFGGGAMVGVASTNENTANLYGPSHASIREFNKKHHYNEWQFIYDPQSDTGALPKGPWEQQTLGVAGQGGQQIGTPAGQLNGPSPDSQQSVPEPVRDVRQ